MVNGVLNCDSANAIGGAERRSGVVADATVAVVDVFPRSCDRKTIVTATPANESAANAANTGMRRDEAFVVWGVTNTEGA
jgi:hypothetical protein